MAMFRILVIEDETILREEMVEWLTFEAYEAFGASDGVEGVNTAFQCQPDLVLCDIVMPHLDGYGVLRALQANPATAKTPVVFVTARADRSDIQTGLAHGICGYITKPFSRSELLGMIETCIQKDSSEALTKGN